MISLQILSVVLFIQFSFLKCSPIPSESQRNMSTSDYLGMQSCPEVPTEQNGETNKRSKRGCCCCQPQPQQQSCCCCCQPQQQQQSCCCCQPQQQQQSSCCCCQPQQQQSSCCCCQPQQQQQSSCCCCQPQQQQSSCCCCQPQQQQQSSCTCCQPQQQQQSSCCCCQPQQQQQSSCTCCQPQQQQQSSCCCCQPQQQQQSSCCCQPQQQQSSSCCQQQQPACCTVQPQPTSCQVQPQPVSCSVQPPPVNCQVQPSPVSVCVKTKLVVSCTSSGQPSCCCTSSGQPTCSIASSGQPSCCCCPSSCCRRRRRSVALLRQKLFWRKSDTIPVDHLEVLENCLFETLVQKEERSSGDSKRLYQVPPRDDPDSDLISLHVDNVAIRRVELTERTSSQFSIQGELQLSWKDSRLAFDGKDWKMDVLMLHDNHNIWAPKITDESYTGMCKITNGCWTLRHRTHVETDGKISAIYSFRYPSYCVINYRRYPEEKNECCVFFSAGEEQGFVDFEIKTQSKTSVEKSVPVRPADSSMGMPNEHSAWTVEDRTIGKMKVAGLRNPLLRICVHAAKRMGTLKTALRFPVTIATMVMLVSPLFGDLRTQIYVKLLTLSLQTISFIYLCAVAPPNGFEGQKPKIYTFFETIFILTWISVVLSLLALALCRMRRTVPPPHRIFLIAKLINRVVCCIDPDPSIPYQRHVNETPQTNLDTTGPDYTVEWQHIYIAANNFFSFIGFIVFVFVAIFDIL